MPSFWHILIWSCVIWYSTITIYVSVRGAFDIRSMLARLKDGEARREEEE